MKVAKKFTFKTDFATGRWRSFYHDTHNVKLNKVNCGIIGDKVPHRVRLQVVKKYINEDGNPNCIWKWITFKKEFKTIQEAKDWLNRNFEQINAELKIYVEEKK